jgi:enoyl-CoA hydratase/carnithine racemase
MKYTDYKCLRIRTERGVAFVTVDHPPFNLFDTPLFTDLYRFIDEVEKDDSVQVIVFESADPEFFMAHTDLNNLRAVVPTPTVLKKQGTLSPFHQLAERYRTSPKVTIARIEGRVHGAGNEFSLALDMRFAATETAIFGQPEVLVGILPGGGGTQRLPRLIGRSRALEMILSGQDVRAELAERYGWINRAFPLKELGPYVEQLAFRIASFSPVAVRLAKQSIGNAELPLYEGLLEEYYLFQQTAASPEGLRLTEQFLAGGGQTRQKEMSLEWMLDVPK